MPRHRHALLRSSSSLARLWEGAADARPVRIERGEIEHRPPAHRRRQRGLIKTLLAMQHGKLPPVANEHPGNVGWGSPFRGLKEAGWDRRAACAAPRRRQWLRLWRHQRAPADRGGSAGQARWCAQFLR
jgi:hypothetical protein